MTKIAQQITDLIGRTPLVALNRYCESHALTARIVAKVESFNPAGSAKDRVALAMIEEAEGRGVLRPGGTIIEPTSGNTGIGLALVAAVKGYRLILTMPETMSEERRRLLAAYGAELVLTPGAQGMQGAVERANALCAATPGSVILQQFANRANPLAHRLTTGEEIWSDTDGRADIFVACVGTGGTVSGTGAALKAHNPAIRVVAVEPAESPLLTNARRAARGEAQSATAPQPHGIQGIGANFIPDNYDDGIVDDVLTVTTDEAFAAMRSLTHCEGILAGISSGAALAAATRLARLPENQNKLIVVLLPDSGERYLSVL